MVPKVLFHAHDREIHTTAVLWKGRLGAANGFWALLGRPMFETCLKLIPREFEYRPMTSTVFEVV
jgi:hypothetical protein